LTSTTPIHPPLGVLSIDIRASAPDILINHQGVILILLISIFSLHICFTHSWIILLHLCLMFLTLKH